MMSHITSNIRRSFVRATIAHPLTVLWASLACGVLVSFALWGTIGYYLGAAFGQPLLGFYSGCAFEFAAVAYYSDALTYRVNFLAEQIRSMR